LPGSPAGRPPTLVDVARRRALREPIGIEVAEGGLREVEVSRFLKTLREEAQITLLRSVIHA
jgi:hypothetical protein